MILAYIMKLTRMKMNLDDIIYTKWSNLVRFEDLKTVNLFNVFKKNIV